MPFTLQAKCRGRPPQHPMHGCNHCEIAARNQDSVQRPPSACSRKSGQFMCRTAETRGAKPTANFASVFVRAIQPSLTQ